MPLQYIIHIFFFICYAFFLWWRRVGIKTDLNFKIAIYLNMLTIMPTIQRGHLKFEEKLLVWHNKNEKSYIDCKALPPISEYWYEHSFFLVRWKEMIFQNKHVRKHITLMKTDFNQIQLMHGNSLKVICATLHMTHTIFYALHMLRLNFILFWGDI